VDVASVGVNHGKTFVSVWNFSLFLVSYDE
jgi:hypothetical protein